MKKFVCVALLLALTMSACVAFALIPETDKDGIYQNAIHELESYLEGMANGDNTLEQLSGAAGDFDELGNYDCSRELYYYTCILMNIDCEDYTDWRVDVWLEQLSRNGKFDKFLEELGGSAIPNAETLKNYYLGRMAEYNKDTASAFDCYDLCMGAFDAMDRQFKIQEDHYASIYRDAEDMMAQEKYEEAYFLFEQCYKYRQDAKMYAEFIIGKLGYNPAICNGEHQYYRYVILFGNCLYTGEAELSCTECGKVEYETLEKDSTYHIGDMKIKDATEATCGKDGYSGDTYCDACNKVINSGKVIKATGKHQWKDATYNAPKTCTVCGLTNGKALSLKAKACIVFGHYPQTSAGNDNTSIEWLVLDYDAKNNKALLISRYALDCVQYNTSYTDVTWETCTLRKWLNSTFLDNAFNSAEKKAILKTKIDNSKKQGYYSTNGGNNTKDKVFVLSYAEAWKYFKKDNERRCQPTDYAIKQDAGIANGYCWWWLRSPGMDSTYVCSVEYEGMCYNNDYYDPTVGVRPALWLDLSSDAWKLAN